MWNRGRGCRRDLARRNGRLLPTEVATDARTSRQASHNLCSRKPSRISQDDSNLIISALSRHWTILLWLLVASMVLPNNYSMYLLLFDLKISSLLYLLSVLLRLFITELK